MKGGYSIKTITIRLEDELHKQFKLYAVKNDKVMQEILVEFIEKLMKKENQPQ